MKLTRKQPFDACWVALLLVYVNQLFTPHTDLYTIEWSATADIGNTGIQAKEVTYGICKNNHLVQCINIDEESKEVPELMIIFTTCGMGTLSIRRTSFPGVQLQCDPRTKRIDCKEAVPLLNFLIDTYDAPLAKRYVFAHGHDFSWHYRVRFFDALNIILKSEYYKTRNFGGIYGLFFHNRSCGPGEEGWADDLYRWIYKGTSMPEDPIMYNNLRPCCSTFWLDSKLIHTRQKWEYVLIRDRLRQWSTEHMNLNKGPGYYCSRTMEYTWHILLSNQSYIDFCRESACKRLNH